MSGKRVGFQKKERQRPDTEIEIERINETYKQTRTDT